MTKDRIIAGILKRIDKAGQLKRCNFTTHTTINNKKFSIPIINGIGYQLIGGTETWAHTLFKKLLQLQQGTFVDVGANNGQTLLKVASLRQPLSYVGFEPNPGCFYYLQRLARKNDFTGYDIFPVGLHYENKVVTLISDNDFASGASIIPKFRNNIHKYKIRQHVPVMKGDEVLTNLAIENIAVIKADVEGAELEVIRGLQQTISKHQPFIMLEILPVYDNVSENGMFRKQRQDELLNILRQLDYAMYRINEKDITLTALDDIEIHSDMSKTNYLFAPGIKTAQISNTFTVK